MPHFSVKKPYTVLVAVVIIILLGFVSFSKLSTDLLPSMNFPYAMVMTTYQGATPEQVEMVVTDPIESAVATISNIKHIHSVSSENYSLVMMEFNTNTNMDSVTIELRESLDLLTSYWPEEIGSPIIMKLNPDMMPVMMASIHGEGMTSEEVSDLYNEKIQSEIKSIEGVASVTASGLVDSSVHVVLNEDKIRSLSEKITGKVTEEFDQAGLELDQARQGIEEGQSQLQYGKEEAAGQMALLEEQLNAARIELASGENEILRQKTELMEKEMQLLEMEETLKAVDMEYEGLLAEEEELNNRIQEYKSQVEQLTQKRADCVQEQMELESPEAQNTYNGLVERSNQLQQEIEKLQADSAMAEDQKYEQLMQLETELAEVNSEMASIDLRKEQLPIEIESIDQALEGMSQGLDAAALRLGEVTAMKGMIESDQESRDEARKKISEGRAALELGKTAIAEAEEEVASGKMSLSEASVELSKNKSLSMLEMSEAEAELAMGEMQLDEADAQLQEARRTGLEKSDLGQILTKDTLMGILTAQNFSMPAGYVKDSDKDYMVRIGEKFESLKELEDMIILDLSGQNFEPIHLKDVADITLVSNSSNVYGKMNGSPAILISVEKQNGYSTADVARKVREYMQSDSVKVSGLTLTPLMDQGIYIDMVIHSVLSNLIVGALLAVIVLLIFLKDWRATLIIALSIPVSVFFAIVLMYFSGVTINIISLSGLALGVGMLVDNSIVVIENIFRLRDEGENVITASVLGAKQVMGAIAASTLTTICIWFPIVFTEGITRQMFVDMVLTIAYSLLASLVVALTVVPMMASKMMSSQKVKEFKLFDRMVDGYEKVLRWSLKHKAPVLLGSAGLLAVSAALTMTKGMEFMGKSDSPQISVSAVMDEDTTFDEAVQTADELMARIQKLDAVQDVGAILGSGLTMMTSMGNTETDSVSLYVILKEDRKQTSFEVASEIEKVTKDMDCEVSASGSTMDMSALGGTGIQVMIKGKDLDTLQQIANDYAGILEKIEGTKEVSNGQDHPVPELRITVDKNKAMLHNLTIAQIYQQLTAVMAEPKAASVLSTKNGEYDIYVMDRSDTRMPVNELNAFRLTTKDASGSEQLIPLNELASVTEKTGLSSVQRDKQQRYISVSCEVKEGYNTTLIADEFKKAVSGYELPDGYKVEYSGETESIAEAMKQLLLLLGLGILIMYLIMVAQFQSLLSPLIVMFTVPLAFTGGFLGLLLTGKVLSVIGTVGFVMLCGIIVNNGIVFIDYTNQLREKGMNKKEALITAGRTRMRPILMTALTTILAMSTMAFGIGEGSDMVQPMAIITMGGMIYGTCLTLIVVPVIYDLLHHKERRKMKDLPDTL